MSSFKAGFELFSTISRFRPTLSRQIFLSSQKQVSDSGSMDKKDVNVLNNTSQKQVTTNDTGEMTPTAVGVEKTINSVTLLGRVGSNPVQRGSLEHPVVTFSIATNSSYSYSNGEINQKTEWHRICVFKPYLRDSTLKYTNKGQRVLVQGRIMYGEVKDTDGNLRHTCSVVADDVIFFKNG